MAGTSLECELSRDRRERFSVATPSDEAGIRRLLRDHPMAGSVRLTFEREPDYFRSAGIAGAGDQTIVAHAGDRLVCMGRCSRRDCWIDGRVANVGYLAELRLDASARGKFAFVRGGYRFFRELEQLAPAEFYFTSIAAENERARRFLERGARGMPAYRFLGELATVLVAVPRRPRVASVRLEAGTARCLPEMLHVLNESARRSQLAAVWTEENVRALEQHGLPLSRFFLARAAGRIVACGALWDQRGFRQTVIRGYSPELAAIKPLVNMVAHLFGTARLPPAGAVLSHAFLSPLAFADGAGTLLPDFITACFPSAKQVGIEYLTLALPADDPRLETVRGRFATRVYRSRLYRVVWPGDDSPGIVAGDRRFLPDVSLL